MGEVFYFLYTNAQGYQCTNASYPPKFPPVDYSCTDQECNFIQVPLRTVELLLQNNNREIMDAKDAIRYDKELETFVRLYGAVVVGVNGGKSYFENWKVTESPLIVQRKVSDYPELGTRSSPAKKAVSECPQQQNHAVVVVGFTAQYWIIQNSRGVFNGYQGFWYLDRWQNTCGILSTRAWALALPSSNGFSLQEDVEAE